MRTIKFRVYADGSVVHEDDFAERDNSQPYYDDYGEYEIPVELFEFIHELGWDEGFRCG